MSDLWGQFIDFVQVCLWRIVQLRLMRSRKNYGGLGWLALRSSTKSVLKHATASGTAIFGVMSDIWGQFLVFVQACPRKNYGGLGWPALRSSVGGVLKQATASGTAIFGVMSDIWGQFLVFVQACLWRSVQLRLVDPCKNYGGLGWPTLRSSVGGVLKQATAFGTAVFGVMSDIWGQFLVFVQACLWRSAQLRLVDPCKKYGGLG